MSESTNDVEHAVRAARGARDYRTAATLALDAQGPEILGLLVAKLHATSDGEEAFRSSRKSCE